MATVRPEAQSVQVAVGRVRSRQPHAASAVDARPAKAFADPDGSVAADFVDWARDVGMAALGGTAVDEGGDRKPDGASIRVAFKARQDFKAAFFECLKSGATVVEHPRRTDENGLSALLRDPEGHRWELTAPA